MSTETRWLGAALALGILSVSTTVRADGDTCLGALKLTCDDATKAQRPTPPSGCDYVTVGSVDAGYVPSARVAKETSACGALANQVADEASQRLDLAANAAAAAARGAATHLVTRQDVEATNRTYSGTQGSPGQVEAVPSIQPTSMTSGTLSIAGTRGGFRIVADAAVNPISILSDIGSSPDTKTGSDAKTYAVTSRILDIALVLPINPLGTGGGANAFDYVGVRLKANLLAGLSGGKAADGAQRAYAAAITSLKAQLGAEGDLISVATSLISTSPTKYECRQALGVGDAARIDAACGKPAPPEMGQFIAADATLRQSLANARAEADAAYLGLDARMDFGDPTFSGDPAARGTYLFLGVAGGYRLNLQNTSGHVGLRFRVAASYAALSGLTPATSFDFGGAVEGGVTQALHETDFSVGIEGRQGKSPSTLIDTNYVDLRLGLSIPLSDAAKLGVGISLPLQGQHGTVITFTGSWAGLMALVQNQKP